MTNTKTVHVCNVYTWQGQIVSRPRLRRGEYYRVETRCPDGVVSRRRYTRFADAMAAVRDAESSGCNLDAEVSIRRDVSS